MLRNSSIIAAYLILQNKNKILLLKRKNTGYHDGEYSLIAGHVEPGESFTTCIIREALEEAGVKVTPSDLKVSHVMHRKSHHDDSERVDVFFWSSNWSGEITNLEPEKCAELQWYSLIKLPNNIVPCVRHALDQIQSGKHYSEYGW